MVKAYHRLERSALADLFDELGPKAPTMCEGWTTADLAAHAVVREGRLDVALGIWVAALAGRTERVQTALRDGTPWPRLVDKVRTGPPAWSLFRLADAAANTVEFFIHHEDVRRAQPSWTPRELEPEFEALLWEKRKITKLFTRGAPTGVVIHWPGHESFVARAGEPAVTVSGAPGELLMFTSGRKSVANVELSGDPTAVQLLRDGRLAI